MAAAAQDLNEIPMHDAGRADRMWWVTLSVLSMTFPKAATDERPWFTYLLPYYRPSWGPGPGAAHEVGLMFKFNYELVRGGPWH